MSSLREQIAALAAEIVERQYALEPQIWERYGAPGRALSLRDQRYHLDYLAEAVDADAPELFTSYLGWVKALFAGLHFPDSILFDTLQLTRQVLAEQLPEAERDAALSILDQGLDQLPGLSAVLPSYIGGDAPLDELARGYLGALLAGDRLSAHRLIQQAVAAGTSVQDIYLRVFQRTQREIGRLWQLNRISVAQEHYCTAATQTIMAQLYPYIFTTGKKGRSLVATCVGGELHELGARMVADLLELAGWDTYFLGANTPAESIVRALAERRAGLLAISVTMPLHLGRVRELIEDTRHGGLAVSIMVGGYSLNRVPGLWQKLGADGYAPDAEQAVAVAERLVPQDRLP